MRHINIICFSTLLLNGVGCTTTEPLGIARRVATSCAETVDDRFFGGVFSGLNEHNSGAITGISTFLVNIGEPSLSCGVHASETYRLVYMPERGDPFAIRVQRHDDSDTVTISSTGSAPSTPRPSNQTLSRNAWEKVTNAMSSYNFWSRSPYASRSMIHSGVIVLHGPAWLLEGQRDGWYHAVSRVSAAKEREFDAPARSLFEVAGLPVPDIVKPRR
jgi:hypothetical protein